MQALIQIQAATLAARQRLNDSTIATRVDNGRIQVVRVTYPTSKTAAVAPASPWMPVAAVCDFLSRM